MAFSNIKLSTYFTYLNVTPQHTSLHSIAIDGIFVVVVVNLPVLTFPSSLNGVVSLRLSFLDWVYILPFSPISIIFCKSPSPIVTLLNRECCIEMCNFNQVQYKTWLYRDLTQDLKQTEKALYL